MTTRCQQDEVYAAERDVPDGATFLTAADAQAFMDDLMSQWWWSRFYWKGPERVEVYFRSRGRSVNKYDKTKDGALIELTVGQRDVKTLVHELAHILTDALSDERAHGPFFARTYAVLVFCVMGPESWLTLQRGYEKFGVDYMQNREVAS